MQIIKKGKQYKQYINKYNSGDLINSLCEIKVLEQDAVKAQQSEQNAFEVILKYQSQQNNFTNE